MIIAVDAGHGRHTPGKRFPNSCTPDVKPPAYVPEWEPNQAVATLLCNKLRTYKGVSAVRMDDVTGETDVNIHTRPAKANQMKADLYISLHHNAATNAPEASGIVVFVYDKTQRALSIKMQETAYKHLIKETGMKGNRANGTARKNLCVLRESNCPAILCELGFMTNPEEARIIRTADHAEKCARALAHAVAEVYNLEPIPAPEPVKPATLYRVQVGAYHNRAYAVQMRDKLKSAGYPAYIKEE